MKNPETILTSDHRNEQGAIVPPIYQNSLFEFESWDAIDAAFSDRENHYIYSRGNNPTVQLVEEKLAQLAEAEKAKLFPSGMAAITAACLHALEPDAHIITINNLYGPAKNLVSTYLPGKMGVSVTFVSGKSVEEFEEAIQPNTRLIYLESPSSAVFSLQDIEAITLLAKKRNILTICDNTWATPLHQKTLSMGVDIEIHSTTKYLGGHSDLVGGLLLGSSEIISSIQLVEYEMLGPKVAPFEAWLLLRSLRSLPARLRQHQESAMEIAQFLENHEAVEEVNYPGLESFDQYELGKKQLSGYTGLMSFKLKTNDLHQVKHFMNSLQIFKIGVSWGGHESLVFVPAIAYLKELSPEKFEAMGISLGDVRISVGLEHKDDLIEDLRDALKGV